MSPFFRAGLSPVASAVSTYDRWSQLGGAHSCVAAGAGSSSQCRLESLCPAAIAPRGARAVSNCAPSIVPRVAATAWELACAAAFVAASEALDAAASKPSMVALPATASQAG